MLNSAGIGNDGFHAVMRLIRKGILTDAGGKRITLSPVVAKGVVANGVVAKGVVAL